MPKLSKEEELARKQAILIKEMCQSEGWQQVLQPWLVAKRDQSFPDPASFEDKEKFLYAATVSSLFKKVVAELLMFVEEQEQTLKALNKKKYGKPDEKFKIGQ